MASAMSVGVISQAAMSIFAMVQCICVNRVMRDGSEIMETHISTCRYCVHGETIIFTYHYLESNGDRVEHTDCLARGPRNSSFSRRYFCTRPRYHKGRHVACYTSVDDDADHVLDSWK